MTDFNTAQMSQLLGQSNVTVVYLWADGDYWLRQQEFCAAFRATPPTHNVVIHVQFEGLSLTQAGVVEVVQKIMQETGRDANSIYIFSPNSINSDCPWPNLFWRLFSISDEFTRSQIYWRNDVPPIEHDFKTWALFVGRRTTPRLLALYDIWQNPKLKQNCLLSVLTSSLPAEIEVFDQPDKIHDRINDWIPSDTMNDQQNNFKAFCKNMPLNSVDGKSVDDQYTSQNNENRNISLPLSLINLSGRYLFEIVFETMTLGSTFTPSEKTIRTIVAQKPFVAYAPNNFLSNLRSLGFQTFGELWDESYDLLEGKHRYQAIMQIVRQISTSSRDNQLNLHTKVQNICVANKKLLSQYIMAQKHSK
jgi:hypothetical protein